MRAVRCKVGGPLGTFRCHTRNEGTFPRTRYASPKSLSETWGGTTGSSSEGPSESQHQAQGSRRQIYRRLGSPAPPLLPSLASQHPPIRPVSGPQAPSYPTRMSQQWPPELQLLGGAPACARVPPALSPSGRPAGAPLEEWLQETHKTGRCQLGRRSLAQRQL